MMRIAILCNDRLALPALSALLSAGRVAAVAMPDGRQDIRPIVERLCADTKTPCSFFEKKDFGWQLINWLHAYAPNVVLVKTFPWKIPVEALSIPAHGFINFHYAPLPAWRGPNPLFWMIRDRVNMAGITVHKMNADYDSGPVLLQLPVPIQPDITFGILYTQLAFAGLQITDHLLQRLQAGTLTAIPQDHNEACWHRRPVAADLMIDWNKMGAIEVQALVKACNPWNKGAATSWNGWGFGITDASVVLPVNYTNTSSPGTILELDPINGLLIACADGQVIKAEVVYCEEGFFAGHHLSLFGMKKHDRLGAVSNNPTVVTTGQEEMIIQ